ncbi:hypothetical protein [Proteus penneri]|uniref:E3 ubiquitin-protein ligase SopA n=1 Tax=Proteus penneri TaxID=102862 RepID=A0A0G4QB07_9GAMM|nr:hypothetical protein [Proteus penneri]CRL62816.1 E3 ubiquitin-protein ligase SopA [Proteus penneri]
MINVLQNLKSHLSNRALSAPDFTHKNLSLNNTSFPDNLLSCEIKNKDITLSNRKKGFKNREFKDIKFDFLVSNLSNVKFTNDNLDGVELNSKAKSFNKTESDYLLNEKLSGNTLNKLNTISDEYKEIKIKLVKQIVESINNSGEMKLESFPIDSIIDNITSKKYYLEDGVIKDFAKKLLDIKYLKERINMYSDKLSSGILSFNLDLISELDNGKIKEYMVKKNGCFMKLMALTVFHDDLAIQEKGRSLYNNYLEIEEIKDFVKEENLWNNKTVDWSDKKNKNYIIVSGDKTIVISHEDLVNMLFPDEIGMNASWNKFSLYIKGKRKLIEQTNYYDLFNKDFEMFKDSYNALHTK